MMDGFTSQELDAMYGPDDIEQRLQQLCSSIDDMPLVMWAKYQGSAAFLPSMANGDFPPRGLDCPYSTPRWREAWWSSFFTCWIWYLNHVKGTKCNT